HNGDNINSLPITSCTLVPLTASLNSERILYKALPDTSGKTIRMSAAALSTKIFVKPIPNSQDVEFWISIPDLKASGTGQPTLPKLTLKLDKLEKTTVVPLRFDKKLRQYRGRTTIRGNHQGNLDLTIQQGERKELLSSQFIMTSIGPS